MEKERVFNSQHIEIEKIAEGVYAAIAQIGGWAIGNAGLIDLGGEVIAFDTFMTPKAASELRQFSIDTFGRAPGIVINSHYHNDHIWGNQVFADEAKIYSSAATRELITTSGMEEYNWFLANSAQRLAALEKEYEAADEEGRNELIMWLAYYQALVEEMPKTEVHLPEITFEDRLELAGDRYKAEILTLAGHTGSDSVLVLPEAGIVFASDLLFVGCHPYLADGDPDKLLEALAALRKLDAEVYVPGHGPVGTTADLDLLAAYVEGCMELARSLTASGEATENQIQEASLPEGSEDWDFEQFFRMSLQFLCNRLAS